MPFTPKRVFRIRAICPHDGGVYRTAVVRMSDGTFTGILWRRGVFGPGASMTTEVRRVDESIAVGSMGQLDKWNRGLL